MIKGTKAQQIAASDYYSNAWRQFMFDSNALAKLTGSATYNSAKIQGELDFSPEWTIEQALPSIVQSYIQKK